ncbi:MAG: response regulator transcription factor, partial [Clostridia bacterium]|nr:response regulator transcription factor [Clostridia bacterium]
MLPYKSSNRGHFGFKWRKSGPSEREKDLLRLLARGYSNQEIATQLCISVKTVETHKA